MRGSGAREKGSEDVGREKRAGKEERKPSGRSHFSASIFLGDVLATSSLPSALIPCLTFVPYRS